MKPPFIRSPYNYDTAKASDEAAYTETMPSLTVQSQTIDTDINEIMRRVGVGAPMPTNIRQPEYGDYTHIQDFRSAIEAVRGAEENFMRLPAATRAAFQNDPQLFLEAFYTPGNEQALRDLGLLNMIQPKTTPETPNATSETTAPPTEKK